MSRFNNIDNSINVGVSSKLYFKFPDDRDYVVLLSGVKM